MDALHLSVLALAALFEAVKEKVGIGAFNIYPNHTHLAQVGKSRFSIRDALQYRKRSLFAYWAEVLVWHLKDVRKEASGVSFHVCIDRVDS